MEPSCQSKQCSLKKEKRPRSVLQGGLIEQSEGRDGNQGKQGSKNSNDGKDLANLINCNAACDQSPVDGVNGNAKES